MGALTCPDSQCLCIANYIINNVWTSAGAGQAVVAAGVTQQMLSVQPQKHVVYVTDRVHLLYQQAAVFTSELGFPVCR